MGKPQHIGIVGAGLVGSLLGILFRQRGFDVSIYEKRGDLRKATIKKGRSINLALSDRGIRTLKDAGVYAEISDELVPMKGRMIHQGDSSTFQPYGEKGQFINSVSRIDLNRRLISLGEEAGINYHFDHRCVDVNTDRTTVYFGYEDDEIKVKLDFLVGADGAFSEVRKSILEMDKSEFDKSFLDYGYKELTIPEGPTGFQLEPNYLHIWPRGHFMLIALPNPNKTFTCTLFLPYEGAKSFENLTTKAEIKSFFSSEFPEVQKLMPSLESEFLQNPTSSLVTIKSFPWSSNRTMVLGDAAHAIVPFYGQGMNAGFEDCRVLMELVDRHHSDWDLILPIFESTRKKDTDAISELALKNFEEMRSKVMDGDFLERKKIESKLHKLYPQDWVPLYTMVTFSHMPYHQALIIGQLQDQVFKKAKKAGYLDNYSRMVEELNILKKAALTIPQ